MTRQEIFTDFLNKNYKILRFLASQRERNPEDRDDLLQTVLYRVYKSFDDSRTLEMLYVIKALDSVKINRYKAKKRRITEFSPDLTTSRNKHITKDINSRLCYENFEDNKTLSPEQEFFSNLGYENIKTMIASLPYPHDITLHLFLIEDLSYKEIAKQMHISIGTVKSGISRGRTKLKEMIRQAREK